MKKHDLIELKKMDGSIIITNKIQVQYVNTRDCLTTKEVTPNKFSDMENDPFHYQDLIIFMDDVAYEFIAEFEYKWFGNKLLNTAKIELTNITV